MPAARRRALNGAAFGRLAGGPQAEGEAQRSGRGRGTPSCVWPQKSHTHGWHEIHRYSRAHTTAYSPAHHKSLYVRPHEPRLKDTPPELRSAHNYTRPPLCVDVTASVGSVGVIWVGRDATVTPHEVLTHSLTNLLTYYAPNRVLFVLIHNIIQIRIIHNTRRFALYCATLHGCT